MQTFTLFTVATLLSLVSAHGIPEHVTVSGGQTINSPLIGSAQPPGPFWLASDNSPVTDTTSPTTLCGRVATKSTSSLSVKAGDTLSYSWGSGYGNENGPWPHNTGPMLFYMAKCDGDCNDISGSTKFYKLQQQGFISSGVWAQANVHAGQTVDFTVPKNLASGNYVIRHEIVNLASTAEMFPACLTVTVSGSGTDTFSGNSVTFPGAYSASDPGLAVAGAPVYSITSDAGYVFPGGALASVGQGSSSSSGNSGSEPASSSSTTTTPTQVVQGAGSDPATSTTDPSSSTTASSTDSAGSTSPSSSSSSTGTPPSTDSTPSTNTSSGTSAGTSTLASCAQAWNDCNAKYDGSAAAQADYTCQTDYNSCVAAAMLNGNVRRMHRRRRTFFDAVSH